MACDLRIPWPLWAEQGDPKKEEENYRSIERWADNLLKNCLPAAGGAPVYCATGAETVSWFGNTATRTGTATDIQEITLTARSTIQVTMTGWLSWATAPVRGSTIVAIPEVSRQSYVVEWSTPASTVSSAYVANWSTTFAVTLDAGTYTFDPRSTVQGVVTNGATTDINYRTSFVVGTNTEDDCTETPST